MIVPLNLHLSARESGTSHGRRVKPENHLRCRGTRGNADHDGQLTLGQTVAGKEDGAQEDGRSKLHGTGPERFQCLGAMRDMACS